MDDVHEQLRIFVGFFVVQIYQPFIRNNSIYQISVKNELITSDYYSGVKSALRWSTPLPLGEDPADPPTAPGCGAEGYTPKTAAEPATTRC